MSLEASSSGQALPLLLPAYIMNEQWCALRPCAQDTISFIINSRHDTSVKALNSQTALICSVDSKQRAEKYRPNYFSLLAKI
ncbi:MAG: hypothetical protein ACE5FU_05540 [Nitrospinota bacterium]